MVVNMTTQDNLRLEIYQVLKEQGLLSDDLVRFNIELNDVNLKEILSKVESKVETPINNTL